MTISPAPTILIEELEKRFGSTLAVANISLSVNSGEIVCLLGPNGAGKSTTLRMAAGYIDPDAGRVAIAGLDMQRQRRAAQACLGYLAEGAPGYESLTALELFRFVGRARGMAPALVKTRMDEIIVRVDLSEHVNKRFETLSKGYRRRVSLGAALLGDPAALILDEPTDGLDPNQKRLLRRDLRELARTKAILVSTHILEEVPALADRVVVIHSGRVVFEGTPLEFADVADGSLDAAFERVTTGAGQ